MECNDCCEGWLGWTWTQRQNYCVKLLYQHSSKQSTERTGTVTSIHLTYPVAQPYMYMAICMMAPASEIQYAADSLNVTREDCALKSLMMSSACSSSRALSEGFASSSRGTSVDARVDLMTAFSMGVNGLECAVGAMSREIRLVRKDLRTPIARWMKAEKAAITNGM